MSKIITLRVNLEDLDEDKRNRTPILTYCRKLIEDGFDPNSKLHVYRQNQSDPDVIVNNIEDAAKLSVFENRRYGPTFVKFQEWHPSSLSTKKDKLNEDVH